jgi:hypothetical protein
MVDFTSTQAQAKEDQAKATAAKTLSTSPPLTSDGVDKMYHQLAEIHTIATMQLVECARWHRSDSTPSWFRPGPVGRGPPQCHPR